MEESYLTRIVANPDAYYPVYSSLMRVVDTQSIIRLRQTSRRIYNSIHSNEWDINKRLRPFSQDPCGFRTALGRCNGLITGTFPLQFLARKVWSNTIITIQVDGQVNCQRLRDYLVNEQGYKESNTKRDFMDNLFSAINSPLVRALPL